MSDVEWSYWPQYGKLEITRTTETREPSHEEEVHILLSRAQMKRLRKSIDHWLKEGQ